MTKFLGLGEGAAAFRAGGADAVEADIAPGLVIEADRAEPFAALTAARGPVKLCVSEAHKGRLLDVMPVPQLARFVALCRERGLKVILAGHLEPPDVPRLLALKPDYLGFEGPKSAEEIAVIRALIPREDEEARRENLHILSARGHAPGSETDTDKLTVRDFIIDMSVGAYAYEHLKPQRVKFDVTAEVRRRTAAPKDMRDIFSYDIITDTIRTIAGEGHVDLLETLAENIARALLVHADIVAVHLKLEKLDLGAAIVGIEITRKRAAEAARVRQLFGKG